MDIFGIHDSLGRQGVLDVAVGAWMSAPALLYLDGKSNPVISALAAQGVEIVENNCHPDAALTARLIGVWVNFNQLLKPQGLLRAQRLRWQLRATGIPFLAWNRDAPGYFNKPAWRLHLLSLVSPLDIYATHAVDGRYRFGTEIVYFPNAVMSECYHLAGSNLASLRDPSHYIWDVSCFCGMTPRREEHHDRIRFFSTLEERLVAKGCKVRFIDTENNPLPMQEQIELIQRSRINLSYGASCDRPGRVPLGLTERAYGIPACGGFLLSDHRLHAAGDFVLGDEWVGFSNLADAEAKIDYFLEHFEQSRDIAEAAHRRVMAQHTYAHRARHLIDLLELSRQQRVGSPPIPRVLPRSVSG